MIDLHQKKTKKNPISVHHVDSELLINNHQRLFEIDCRIRLPLETKPKGEQAEHWEEFDVLRPFVHQVVAEVRRGVRKHVASLFLPDSAGHRPRIMCNTSIRAR